MSRSKDKGTRFESQVALYLQAKLGPAIERRALHGTNDRGDIAGVYFMGKPVVIECKNHKRMELAAWMDEARMEAGNADAPYYFTVHHRPGCGDLRTGHNYVTTDLETFCRLISLGVDDG